MTRARELANLAGVSETALSNRNLVTNGACQVAQRSSSVTGITSNGYYTVDRFTHYLGGGGTWTSAQDSNAPSGFANSLKLTCTTANASPSAGTYSEISYLIEAQDLQRLGFGTSTAKTCTLSFWVKSNKTGNFSIYFLQRDNSNKLFSTHYTINTADTWEYKTLTVPADTSGVINDDNGVGMDFTFGLSYGTNFTSGSEQTSWGTNVNANRGAGLNVNLADATSNYWQITGVQLEVGEQATPFEHRSYSDELTRCQRYTYVYNSERSGGYDQAISSMSKWSNGYAYGAYNFPCTMRTAPSGTAYNTSQFTIYIAGSTGQPNTELNIEVASPVSCEMNVQTSLGSTGESGMFRKTGSGTGASAGYIVFDAEL